MVIDIDISLGMCLKYDGYKIAWKQNLVSTNMPFLILVVRPGNESNPDIGDGCFWQENFI